MELKEYKLRMDPSRQEGRLENILGICNSPVVSSAGNIPRQVKWFRELGARYVRHHDAPLENPGLDLVDVSRLFPLFSADENDPANYCFAETDYYFSFFAGTGIGLELRLGETIDHSGLSGRVHPPKDPAKWARICVNILRHYREGWADGMYLDIRRVALWEEPCTVPQLFTGKYEEYIRLYLTAYPILRAAFPELVIGAHNDNWFYGKTSAEKLLSACRDAGVTPGFLGLTMYSRTVEDFPNGVREARALLDKYGFSETEIQFSEWHYGPLCWSGDMPSRLTENGFDSAENAAFTAAVLISLLDSPVNRAYYYAWATGLWGVISPREVPQRLLPVYYGLQFFTRTADFGTRIAVTGEIPEGMYVLAARGEGGKLRVLIACTDCAPGVLYLCVPGYRSCVQWEIADDSPYHPTQEVAIPVVHTPQTPADSGEDWISVPVLSPGRVYALELE